MTDRDERLLRAIAAAPDDDAPRLVYADQLMERGDPRGELIALQCAADADGDAREQALLATHGEAWLGPADPVELELHRGFAEHATVWRDAGAADALATRAPLLRSLAGSNGVLQLPEPVLARIEALELLEIDNLDVVAFAKLPKLRRLQFHSGSSTSACSVAGAVWIPTIRRRRACSTGSRTATPSCARCACVTQDSSSTRSRGFGSSSVSRPDPVCSARARSSWHARRT